MRRGRFDPGVFAAAPAGVLSGLLRGRSIGAVRRPCELAWIGRGPSFVAWLARVAPTLSLNLFCKFRKGSS